MSAAPFTTLTAVAAPILRANVDTDAIIPSREMKSVAKTGLADGLFAGWRYLSIGGRDPNPEFVLNQPAYQGAQILLGGDNFGCGSSREHAVWALAEYGIRAIVAPSFAPIFFGNCVRNGIVPARIDINEINKINDYCKVSPQERRLSVDLPRNEVLVTGLGRWSFALADEEREMLLEGLDAIDLTLKMRDRIDTFLDRDRRARPWIYLGSS